jgi:hypothetical protein
MTREQLIASLTATDNADGLYGIDGDGSIDWSTRDDQSGRRAFEVSNDGDTAQIWMTREDLVALHTQLTLTLLADAK